jgi:oligoribonuclease (3'-5' exoribonuclease)
MNFLPDHLVMVDCEMTGVRPEEHSLLQVAMVKLCLIEGQYRFNPNILVAYLKNDASPSTPFHFEFLSHIFEKCNKSTLTCSELKAQISDWLGDLRGKVMPTGDCISCDMEFLYKNECIDRSGYLNDGTPVLGTFHYEQFDLNPIKLIARQKTGEKSKPAKSFAGKHDAVVDCFNQILELNHFIKILLN